MNDWRDVDRDLRSLAQRRAALDAREARLLREAERLEIWRPLGMVSALDYMERVLGYRPQAAGERLRVARALAALPLLETALDEGKLNYSAVRELTRVAIPSTEARWRDAALGKNMRQVEELVAGRAPGDSPDSPVKPEVQRYKLMLDVYATTFARWRQARTAANEEHGRHLDDDAFANDLIEACLDRAGGEPTGRAKFQIMMTICECCKQGWQAGGGKQVPVDMATVERAECDAQYIGSMTDPLPVRATQDIPPSVVRFVWHRDGGCCTTPGCRSSRGLEIHHIIPRAHGGTHEPSNLRLLCSACHGSLHRGTLALGGTHVSRPNQPQLVEGSAFDCAANRAQARDALVGLGWRAGVARTAVDEAISHVGDAAPLDKLIFEALRRCPRGA